MTDTPSPDNNSRARLSTLREYAVMDTPPEQAMDDLTALAATICGVPIALISLIDEKRQWFKSRVGLELTETPLDVSFCVYALQQTDLLIVPDATKDPRFSGNPLVTGEVGVRFYAGAPLISPEGVVLGTLCVIDRVPRTLTASQEEALRVLSRQVMAHLNLARQARELAASESRTQLVVETSRVGLWSLDLFTNEIFHSNECKRQLGFGPDDLSGGFDQWVGRLHPEDREATLAAFSDYIEGRSANYDLEFRMRHKDGSWRWILSSGSLLRDTAGKPFRMTGCHIDITDHKLAAIASQRLAAIVESSDDAIIGKDLNHIVTSWNKGAEKVFGYPAREMVGTSIMRLIPVEQQEHESQLLAKTMRGELIEHFETKRQTRDGKLIDVSIMTSPIKDAAGEIIGISKVMRDITEERQTARALLASELRYRRLFESALDGILILDAETGMVDDVNPYLVNLLGYSHDQFMGKALWDLGFFNDIVENENKFAELREKEYVRYENMPLETADGRRIDVEFISNVYLVNGIKVIQCNIRDVSARKRAEDAVKQLNADLEHRVAERTSELEVANKELESFSYSVSHDLRAPLRAVDGFAHALLDDFGPQLPEEGQRYVLTIRDGARKMGKLIDDLLSFSRFGRTALRKENVDTRNLVLAALAELEGQHEGRRIDLRIGDLPECHGDPSLLKQVWLNLLSNAFKYTRKRDTSAVEIGCDTTAEGNVYFVRDNGTGFDMQYAGKLFGVFQRLHRAEDFEGTGVGLAIVQQIIQRHGGRVWAYAKEDQGATFYFTLGGTITP